MVAKNINVEETRQTMQDLHEGLTDIYNRVVEDHKDYNVCNGYASYVGETPMAYLDRARTKLEKKVFKIGFAGGFSGGKSTAINALLKEPGLLAAEAGECTMSITVIGSPKPGGDEHVEIKYYSKEQSLRNLFENNRYDVLLRDYKDDVWKEYTDEKAITAIKKVIENLTGDKDLENQKKKAELEEFLQFLDQLSDRLGTTFMDKLENADEYLTTDSNNKGLGHLLLIEQVFIYKNNPLFQEKGIEIIDLPGTDSTNQRQKEITHNYMREADAIILVLEPKGFKMADVDIGEELSKHNNEIRNKMFFVMNKFDTLDQNDIKAESMHKLYRGQVLETIIRLGLDPDRIYFTSAKVVEIDEKKKKGLASQQEIVDLENYKKSLHDKLTNLDPNLNPDVKAKMEIIYKDGGIEHFRDVLMKYLEKDIQVERLKEIYFDLKNAFLATQRLITPEKARVTAVMDNFKNQAGQILEFIEKLEQNFEDHILPITDKLEKALSMGIEKGKEMFKNGLSKVIEGYNFQRVKMKLPIPTAQNIKMEVISECKLEFSFKFAEIMENATVKMVYDKLAQSLSESPIPNIMKRMGKSLGVDFNKRYEELLENFHHNLRLVARLRALEETWEIQQAAIKPSGFEPEWNPKVEADFKEDMKNLFVDKFMGYAGKLQTVLWRYFRELMLDLNNLFVKLVDDLNKHIKDRPDEAKVPFELIADEVEEDKKVDFMLMKYFEIWNAIEPKWEPVAATFEPENGEEGE